MQLKCLKCDRMITPGQVMVAIAVGKPQQWTHAIKSLEITPGVWHYRCTPDHVKGYAPAVIHGSQRVVEDAGQLD